jgi:hypothetical protein
MSTLGILRALVFQPLWGALTPKNPLAICPCDSGGIVRSADVGSLLSGLSKAFFVLRGRLSGR